MTGSRPPRRPGDEPELLPGSPLPVAELLGELRVAVELLRQLATELRGLPMPPDLAERLAVPEVPRPSWFSEPAPRVRLRG